MNCMFFGDSLTLGHCDETGLGWPGRVARELLKTGADLTWYNLGVRADATKDIAERWEAEVRSRSAKGGPLKLVFCFGVADVARDTHRRTMHSSAREMLARALSMADVLVVGPPPVGQVVFLREMQKLSSEISEICQTLGIPYVATIDTLHTSEVYKAALTEGDQWHPTAAGYREWARYLLAYPLFKDFFELK